MKILSLKYENFKKQLSFECSKRWENIYRCSFGNWENEMKKKYPNISEIITSHNINYIVILKNGIKINYIV